MDKRNNRKTKTPDAALTARLVAFDVIRDVLHKKLPLEGSFESMAQRRRLAGSDRAYAEFIVRTVLKRRGQIDALLDHCIAERLPRKALPVLDVLRIGIAQLLFSATADHAAVSTTVDLCRAVDQQPFAKLVNAVMRRLQREGEAMVAEQDPATLNTPKWLWDSWHKAYGGEAARAIAEAHAETPPTDLSVKSNVETWAETLGGNVILGDSIRLSDAENIRNLAGYEEGTWWVQDAAAHLPVRLLGDVDGKRVFDLCAAPGGKTMALASKGAHVTAVDISAKRLERLQENLTRTSLDVDIITSDVRKWSPDDFADIVVLDAPCSSTGTARRHPDILYSKTADDITKLSLVQDELLNAAAELVKPGGLLMYITCSLQPEEGTDRVRSFLERNPAFSVQRISTDELPDLPEAIDRQGNLRTLPTMLNERGGMDGFYAARLQKTET